MTWQRLLRTRTAPREDGLSLVEVMVTLGILAAAATLIVATAPKQDPLQVEARRLAQQMTWLEALAQASGAPTGLAVNPEGYEAMRWQNGAWQTVSGSTRVLPRGLVLTSGLRPKTGTTAADDAPEIMFDPLGHSTLSPLSLSGPGGVMAVEIPDARSAGH